MTACGGRLRRMLAVQDDAVRTACPAAWHREMQQQLNACMRHLAPYCFLAMPCLCQGVMVREN